MKTVKFVVVFEVSEDYTEDKLHEDLCLTIHELQDSANVRLCRKVHDITLNVPVQK